MAGCKKIFPLSAITGEGIKELAEYLEDEEDKKKRLAAEARAKARAAKKKTTKDKTNE